MRQWDRVRAWGSREERLGEQREVRRRMERPEEVRAQWSSNPALSMMGFSGEGGGMGCGRRGDHKAGRDPEVSGGQWVTVAMEIQE